MVAELRKLFVGRPLENEIIGIAGGRQDQKRFANLRSRLQISEDGLIRRVNGVELSEDLARKISYLTGSLNFLFNLVDEEFREDKALKQTIARMVMHLLSRLLDAGSAEEILVILDETHIQRMKIRKELGGDLQER